MSYVIWSSVWHVLWDGRGRTYCGRRLPKEYRRQTLPPDEVFICSLCRSA